MSVTAEALQSDYAETGRKNLSDVVAVRGLAVITRSRELTPINEYGVVEPPLASECLGKECECRGQEKVCLLTRHHLHSTAPDYKKDGTLAEEFRDLGVLTMWLHACVHKAHHDNHEIHVPIPHQKVMKRSLYEGTRIKDLVSNHRENRTNERVLNSPEITKTGIKNLGKVRRRLEEEREEILGDINNFEVIPQALTTGALLLVAPEVARHRVASGSGVALPGLLQRVEIPIALQNLEEITDIV